MPTTTAIDLSRAEELERERFELELEGFEASCRELWFADGGEPLELGPRFDRRGQRRTEARAGRLLDSLESAIERSAGKTDALAALRAERQSEIEDFCVEHLRFEPAQVEILLAEDSQRATADFVREARELVPEVAENDLHQALRNAWIANVLQRLLAEPVELTPAIFAYSMLYPLTDNPLDDPAQATEEKRALGARLGRRLEGAQLGARGDGEAAIFRMVAMIETQYPRELFPSVWAALAAIHRAQLRSLAQQGGVASPYERDVLGLSFAKGGASVLADGYLAAGGLKPDAAQGCFLFGGLLQLLDDLQDASEDLRAGRSTIFTQTARAWPLDAAALRLWAFAKRLLASESLFCKPQNAATAGLVERGVAYLLLHAVAEQPELFTRGFRRHLEGFSPVGFAYLRRERRKMEKRARRVRRALASCGGSGSVWGLAEWGRMET